MVYAPRIHKNVHLIPSVHDVHVCKLTKMFKICYNCGFHGSAACRHGIVMIDYWCGLPGEQSHVDHRFRQGDDVSFATKYRHSRVRSAGRESLQIARHVDSAHVEHCRGEVTAIVTPPMTYGNITVPPRRDGGAPHSRR